MPCLKFLKKYLGRGEALMCRCALVELRRLSRVSLCSIVSYWDWTPVTRLGSKFLCLMSLLPIFSTSNRTLSFCCCLKTLGLHCRDGSAVKGWTRNLVTPPSWVGCSLQEFSLKSGTFSKHYFLPGMVVFPVNPSTRKINKNYFFSV